MVKLTVALAPLASEPSEQAMRPLAMLQLPCPGETDTRLKDAGSMLVSITPVAVEGPRLVMTTA